MTSATDLRNKESNDLKELLSTLRRKQFKLRLVKASGELKETHEIKAIRREIARIETILSERR